MVGVSVGSGSEEECRLMGMICRMMGEMGGRSRAWEGLRSVIQKCRVMGGVPGDGKGMMAEGKGVGRMPGDGRGLMAG
jgi:hypothetical protein